MTKVPAIQGSLVKAINVDVHKSIRLSIDVPIENAMRVLELFGWPTMVNPIPVAIAPLDVKAITQDEPKPIAERKGGKLSRDAAFLCQTGAFWKFMEEQAIGSPNSTEEAAELLRLECRVSSRSELDHSEHAAARFREIKSSYDAWMITA